jgi:TonB-linked SusC/RagA family outer membrane protein
MKNVFYKKSGFFQKNESRGKPGFLRGLLLLHLMLFFFISVSFAQSKKISGTVKDDKGVPLSNVTVQVKGTSTGVTTDSAGAFSINVPNEKAVLVVSYIGFQNQEVSIGNKSNLEIHLAPGTEQQLTDVVVVGYGTQRKVTVTGAVAQVKGSELEKSPTVNLSNALAGRLPGITAVQASGEPGYDGSAIRIRGTNTLGNNDALIVIDGVPDRAGGLERLNPADIESMSVLKDASAAIYGSRAANGVILITTRHGKTGKAVLSYDYNQGWAQPTVIPKMSDAPEYAEMNNELVLFSQVPASQWDAAWAALKQTGTYTRTDNGAVVNAPYQPDAIQKYKDGSDPWGHPNTDWFKSTLKDWSPQSRHNLQISGGTENLKYLASLGYINQDAYYKNSATGYKQYDMRINVDARVNKFINTSLGVTVREEYRFFPTSSAGSIFRMLVRGKPTETAIWPNGLPGPDIENGENPVVITTNATGYDRDRRDYFQTNGKIEIAIPGVEGLKITGSAALDKYIQRVKTWRTPWYLYFWDGSSYEPDGVTPLLEKNVRSTFTDPSLNESDENRLNINLTGLINYDRKFGNHTLNLLAGVTRETIDDDNFSAFRRYFISPAIDQLFAGGDEEKNADGGAYKRARLSYFGRVGYNYKEKYLAEFVWRYDGSYIFPPSGRFGFFPGILAGWRISEENFWKNNITFINNLKLRASWGQLGAEPYYDYDRDGTPDLVEYQFLPTYGFARYVISDAVHKTLYETRVINPNFTWEVANNTNVGLEGSLLQGKINFEFDYFYNKRTKILWRRQGSTPASSGINALLPPENIGKISNKGWEFKVGYNGQTGNFRYSISANGGYAQNKILFFDEPAGAPEWQKATGHPFGTGSDDGTAFLAYQYDGVFRDLKEIETNTIDYSALTGELRPGDMKFKDINNDGKINGDDQKRLDKTATPKFTGGININLQYKNFDCSILFQGATGGLLWIRGAQEGDFGNYLQYTYDHRWSVDNPSSVDPRVSNRNDTYYTGGGAGNNTYYLRNSDYLRLKNAEIGYTLSEAISKRAGISNLRVYVGGLNLITWDKMKLWDPESTSGNGHYYPQARILNAGVRVTF